MQDLFLCSSLLPNAEITSEVKKSLSLCLLVGLFFFLTLTLSSLWRRVAFLCVGCAWQSETWLCSFCCAVPGTTGNKYPGMIRWPGLLPRWISVGKQDPKVKLAGPSLMPCSESLTKTSLLALLTS